MSITIKHLDGPLKGKAENGEQSFGDDVSSIMIGRATEAQVSYPEECIAVDGEHLRLNREADGSYTIELPGSCDVEIDGRAADTGDPVASGSVITVGEGGPRFEVFMPGLTIKHLEGPLAGTHQYFGETKEEITFGRLPRQTDVSYPASCKIVGRMHFTLKRTESGDYCAELTPNHYVQIGQHPADNGALLPAHSSLRLGNETGPSLSADVVKPAAAGELTEANVYVPPVREKIAKADEEIATVKKYGTYALGGLAAALCALVVFDVARDLQHANQVQQLTADLAKVDDTLTQRAADEIDAAEQESVLAAVYLVAKLENGEPVGQATAWAFAPKLLATNAHVTSKIEGHESDFILIGPKGERIPIDRVKTHPGYADFIAYLPTVGGKKGGKFEPLDVINEYDVGIIYPGEPLPAEDGQEPATLKLASEAEVHALKPGTAVAAVGFPIEGMTANMVVEHAPATLHFGNISSLTDVFMCRVDDPANRLLIQHTVPVTGGMSGSPLVDGSGKVIGVVSGGNTDKFVTEVVVPKGATTLGGKPEIEKMRVPSAAMVNFAQRIDLLKKLSDGEINLDGAKSYWSDAAKKFESFFATAKADLVASVAATNNVTKPDSEKVEEGTLMPREAGIPWFDSRKHTLVLEPGHVYGFIANSKSGLPIALNVKKQSTSADEPPVFLKAKADAQQAPVSPLAPATWVTVDERMTVEVNVFGMIKQPADYELYVYDWVKPAESPAADASAAPQP
jgi:hypothetical protein